MAETEKMEQVEEIKLMQEIRNHVEYLSDGDISNLPSNSDRVLQTLRTLRNFCAASGAAQSFLGSLPTFPEKLGSILELCLVKGETLILRVCLQLIGNAVVGNKDNQCILWSVLNTQVKSCLSYDDNKVQYCASMIVYNVILGNENILHSFSDSLKPVLELTQNEDTSEYSVFILELFITKTAYVEKHYNSLETKWKLTILSLIESIAKTQESVTYPTGMLPFLANYFTVKAQSVLQTSDDSIEELDVSEIVQVLGVVNTITGSSSTALREIQCLNDLLITTVGILREVHALSKERNNHFSMLLKMAELENEQNSAVQDHPTFGFKAALVRLIGNLCWKNKVHQDLCRELNVIPLIMDCCSIDARNPFIIQWAVLAMRNLCEDNIENQRVVASIDRRGEVDTARLTELGILSNGSQH